MTTLERGGKEQTEEDTGDDSTGGQGVLHLRCAGGQAGRVVTLC
jgi:hypothetical protein